jgi:hypothetical protein
MALDTTKIRRRLPQPPTDGSPAMMEPDSAAATPDPMGDHQAARRRPRPTLHHDIMPTDGRSLRATGRTVQLNLKTSPETKARFLALAQARGLLMVDLFEQALDALEAEEEKADR